MRASQIIDRLASGRHVSRRDVMQTMAALGLSLTAMPLAGRAARAGDVVTYFTWSAPTMASIL